MIVSYCMRCKKEFGQGIDDGKPRKELSHGYCPPCMPLVRAEFQKQMEEDEARTRAVFDQFKREG